MKNSGLMKGSLATLGMILLILDPKTALNGATEGIGSCISMVIPSLFPFILLSCWMNDSLAQESGHIPEGITKVAGLPKGSGPILISSLLGGYPAGAQAVHRAYSNGILRKEDAERVLSYTNNAGPAFIFGMAGHIFPWRYAPWLLWGIHIFSAWMVRLVIGSSTGSADKEALPPGRDAGAVLSTSKIMCTICVWVTAFRIITSYLETWVKAWMPQEVRTIIFGSLELVNGCFLLPGVADVRVRFIIFSGMLAFGGVCVMMQTVSVVRELSVGYYLMGKVLQTVFSMILSAALVCQKWYLMTVFLIPAAAVFFRSKNKGRNPAPIRV